MGQPGAVLRIGEVGRQTTRAQDRPQSAPAARRHGSRSRREVGALSALPRNRDGVRVSAGPLEHPQVMGLSAPQKKGAANGGSLIAAPRYNKQGETIMM